MSCAGNQTFSGNQGNTARRIQQCLLRFLQDPMGAWAAGRPRVFNSMMLWLGFEPSLVLFLPAETPSPRRFWLLHVGAARREEMEHS